MPRRPTPAPRRSGCPVSIALEVLGDRWSLLVIRDLMVRGVDTFTGFQRSGEGIATNILSERLQRLAGAGIVARRATGGDRRVRYRLTEKGIDLAPVLLELLLWSARHERTAAPDAFIEHVAAHREQFLAEARRRWDQRDPAPLLPRFERDGPGPARPTSAAARRRAGARRRGRAERREA